MRLYVCTIMRDKIWNEVVFMQENLKVWVPRLLNSSSGANHHTVHVIRGPPDTDTERPQSSCDDSQFSSVTQSCPSICDPMDCSMPGLPVHRQLPKLTQTHIHRVGNAIQPSHSLSSASPSTSIFPIISVFSKESGQFFASGGQSIGASASVFPMNIQD